MTMVAEEVYLTTGTRQRPSTSANLGRSLSFGGPGEESSPDDALLASERRKLLLSIAAMPQEMRASVESLAKDQALPLDPLYGVLKELQVDTSASSEELGERLRGSVETLKRLLAARVASRKDPELVRLADLADRALAQGTIALARNYRAKAAAPNRAFDLAGVAPRARDDERASERQIRPSPRCPRTYQ